MLRNHPTLKKLKKKFKKKIFVIGKVDKSKKKKSFLKTNMQESYLILPEYSKKVLHGDKILARIDCFKKKKFAIPRKLMKTKLKKFVGVIKKKNNNYSISPYFSFSFSFSVKIENSFLFKDIAEGDWFVFELTKHRLNGNINFFSKIIKIIAKKNDFFLQWKIIFAYYKLKKKYLNSIVTPLSIKFKNCTKRVDLTHLDFITIDNFETKDIDDALFIKKKSKDEFSLIVAISDTTSYIHANTKLDCVAFKQSFTNYFPGINIPILPTRLSEDIFSLFPHKKKPVLACKFIIKKNGRIKKKSIFFFLAWIVSKAKLSYEDVSTIIKNKDSRIFFSKQVLNQIFLLYKLYYKRIEWRRKKSVIHRNQEEFKFYMFEKKKRVRIIKKKRSIGNFIVEEMMIAANACAGELLSKNKKIGMYNTHSGFNYRYIPDVLDILKKNGMNTSKKELMTLKGFGKVQKFVNTLKSDYLNEIMKKFQSFGKININPRPHFALGLKVYATWTSPIRKYSDMINHRVIKSIIFNNNTALTISRKTISHIENKKRVYKMMLKKIETLFYFYFFKTTKNKEKKFIAEIKDVLNIGLRVTLLSNGANVFILKENLFYRYDNIKICVKNKIIKKNNKIIFKISDRISIKIKKKIFYQDKILAELY